MDIRKALLSALDRAGVEVWSAFWFYDADSADWRLVLAMPLVEERGTSEAYDAIAEVFRPASLTGLCLRQIEVVGPKDPLVASLRQAIETGQSIRHPPIRVARRAFNNIPIEEVYIYRST